MVSMGAVWDRTTDVLRGRTGIIAPIAVGAVFLPNVVAAAVSSYAPKTGSAALLTMAISLLLVLATIWGTLAIIAVATDPATTRADAQRQASARLLPALGIVAVLGAAVSLAFVPIAAALIRAGVDFSRPDAPMAAMSGGAAGFLLIYGLALAVFALWLSARMLLLNPVILNERRGLRSIPRSIELTHGLTWRLIAVLILFSIVVLVPTLAVQAVVGVAVRLLAGADNVATAGFVAATAGAVVTTISSVIAAVFTAQLYVSVRERAAASV